jgi:hypothetical protein
MSKENLLKEELKRHMQLLEYTFYMEEPKDDEENLLLGALDSINEQEPETEEAVGSDANENDPPGPEQPSNIDDDPFADLGGEDTEEGGNTDPFGGDDAAEVEDEVAVETGDDTVEVDVSDIVDKAEQTRTEIEGMTSKMDELLGKLGDLESQVSGMDKVIDKIENLEKEIEERNPTPVEKLEMRSMDSFPYSITLTDYWSDKEGYDVGGTEETEEYTITKGDVDSYSANEIEDSFGFNKNDKNSQ